MMQSPAPCLTERVCRFSIGLQIPSGLLARCTQGSYCSGMALTAAERTLKVRLLSDARECLRLRPPYNPYIFLHMVDQHGPVEACRRVIMELPAHQAPSGFGQLWERTRLDLTAEATVLLRRDWSALFDETVLERAETRLRRCGYIPTAPDE
jgi:hypothetical protein